ncbi:MAG: hypothetical protein FWE42_09285 [Defluviitaleaceae bacterium]|nr:hypothetical protein [Defluviitaleaceae bacterium]
MGWVIIIKIYEDDTYVIYSYSHDSHIQDGTIKIKKALLDPKNSQECIYNFIEVKSSTTDKTNFFAIRVASGIFYKIKKGEFSDFPQKHMFAWG